MLYKYNIYRSLLFSKSYIKEPSLVEYFAEPFSMVMSIAFVPSARYVTYLCCATVAALFTNLMKKQRQICLRTVNKV